MLSCRRAAAAGALLIGLAGVALGQDDERDDGLHRPERLTVGASDQLLGQLTPDGRTLIYVSNRNTNTEIDVQDVADGRSHLLFDEGTDVSWPRVSPDGRALLYVSFRERAGGQLCVRDLPGAGHRRCLDRDVDALQAEWIDARRIALVSRAAVQGDLTLVEVAVGSGLDAKPLLARNLTSPAVSPDGRWIVYVPIERRTARVGPSFAARTAGQLEAVRLDRPGTPPVRLTLDLPGESSQPAFSRDGHSLFVTQFFSDSNQDGSVDNDDHGVLFEVPFPTARDDAPAVAAASFPRQLTDEGWNCQYPAPAADRLIATCSRGEALDLYELPLAGEIPAEWTAERLADEIELGGERAERLLMYRHRLGLATNVVGRRLTMVRLVRLHLEADEFGPAEFYARHLAALNDPDAAGMAEPLLALIDERRTRSDRERGRIGPDLGGDASRRLKALGAEKPSSAAAGILIQIVKSEIEDDLGDKGAARRELAAIVIPEKTPRSILELYYERADALYRELDDRAALVEADRRLAALGSLPPPDQLIYARAAVRALVRGIPADLAAARLGQMRPAPAEAELAFAIDLGRVLLAVRNEGPDGAVKDALLDLYARQTRGDRRRAVIDEAVLRAAEVGADPLIEVLSERYLADVKPGTGERRQAERLYRRVLTTRAYRRMAEGKTDEARADFEAVAYRTGSLESLIGALDLRVRAGEAPAALREKFAVGTNSVSPAQAALARAYLSARAVPRLPEAQRAGAAEAAIADLRGNWGLLRNNRAAQDIFGALLHEQYLATGDAALAERADAHYLIALEEVRGNPRYRATVLGQLGLLQGAVGNYRIALSDLEQRQHLPFPDNAAALAIRLATARALLHVGRDGAAADAADAALAMIPGAPRLERFRPLAVDRAALCNLAAGRFARALELYDQDLPPVDAATGPDADRNRLVAHLARAAAALGAHQPRRALDDLALVDHWLGDRRLTATLHWPHAAPVDVRDTYRLIAFGLRANAERALGDRPGTVAALEQRRATFAERLKRSDRDEDLRALVLAELRLTGETAGPGGAPTEAGRWVSQAIDDGARLTARTHAPVEPAELDALWMAAALGTSGRAPLVPDLAKRLADATTRLFHQHDPAWRTYQAWLEAYQALVVTPPGR